MSKGVASEAGEREREMLEYGTSCRFAPACSLSNLTSLVLKLLPTVTAHTIQVKYPALALSVVFAVHQRSLASARAELTIHRYKRKVVGASL